MYSNIYVITYFTIYSFIYVRISTFLLSFISVFPSLSVNKVGGPNLCPNHYAGCDTGQRPSQHKAELNRDLISQC